MKLIDDRLTVHMPKAFREKIEKVAKRRGNTASKEALERLQDSFKRKPKPASPATTA